MVKRSAKKIVKKGFNWNKVIQEFCAILIGIGIGLYGYESKAALVPLKWQLDRNVAKDIRRQGEREQTSSSSILQNLFGQIPAVNDFWEKTGASRYLNHLDKYDNTMKKWGISGGLQKQVDSLMQSGVEPIPERWSKKENKPFVIIGIVLVSIALFIKIALYLGILDFSRLRLPKKARAPGKKRSNWNAISNEICTFGLSAIGGLYLIPAMESFLRNEETSFPYPWVIAGSFLCFALIKIALRSSYLDFNTWRKGGSLVSSKRFQRFSKSNDWNKVAHQVSTIVLGLFLGFYAYESNIALLPMKWQMDRKVGNEVSPTTAAPQNQEPGFFDKILDTVQGAEPLLKGTSFWKKSGAERYLQYATKYEKVLQDYGVKGHLNTKVKHLLQGGVDYVPNSWTEKGNIPFLIAGLIILMLSFLVKWGLYLHIIDFNRWFKQRKLFTKSKKKLPIDWNTIVQETATIILGTLIGIYTEPCMDYLAGETNIGYPYPNAAPIIVGLCILLKVAIYLKWINLNKTFRKKVKARIKRR